MTLSSTSASVRAPSERIGAVLRWVSDCAVAMPLNDKHDMDDKRARKRLPASRAAGLRRPGRRPCRAVHWAATVDAAAALTDGSVQAEDGRSVLVHELEHPAPAACHARQRVVGDDHGQPGLFHEEL